jgi:hypothetical protein
LATFGGKGQPVCASTPAVKSSPDGSRFAHPGNLSLTPQFLVVGEEQLRQCGLSRQKISYLTAIARAFEEKTLIPSQWDRMSDGDVVRQLVSSTSQGRRKQ